MGRSYHPSRVIACAFVRAVVCLVPSTLLASVPLIRQVVAFYLGFTLQNYTKLPNNRYTQVFTPLSAQSLSVGCLPRA